MIVAIIPVIKQLAEALDAVLTFFHNNVGLSWGTAIIAVTVATRALLVPLTFRSLKSLTRMRALQPQLKEIQEKYKNDKQRMQQEMMRFYQENKINPFSSCIPLIAQAPIFIALYTVLRSDLRVDICGQAAHPCGSAASWFFIPDLTDKASGTVAIALVILFVATQLGSMLVMPMSVDKSQRAIMLVLPAVLVPLIFRLPAGLVLYWITTNIWTIGQQYTVQRILPTPDAPTPEEARAAKPPPPPPKKRKKRR
ncbi:MAG TPA: YidC/Oxa1 family membrane protein insertase [Solirubrobacterales bacterium]|nr:YidC/Oxa1 family membrane protein insertase [Solirubrobacterales bacterium]